jgi:hypothetical protein
MTFQHQAWTFFLTLKNPYNIRSPWFHLFDDHIEPHLFKKMGEEESYLLLTPSSSLLPDARDSDEILSQLDELLSLNLLQQTIKFQYPSPSADDSVMRRTVTP